MSRCCYYYKNSTNRIRNGQSIEKVDGSINRLLDISTPKVKGFNTRILKNQKSCSYVFSQFSNRSRVAGCERDKCRIQLSNFTNFKKKTSGGLPDRIKLLFQDSVCGKIEQKKFYGQAWHSYSNRSY